MSFGTRSTEAERRIDDRRGGLAKPGLSSVQETMATMSVQPVVPERLPEQLGLAGMPRRLFACTPSRLTSWVDCPRRYRLTYLDRPRPPAGPPWAHNSYGAGLHNALAGWWRLAMRQYNVLTAAPTTALYR